MVLAEAWHDSRRILCVRLDAAGDVIMTTPAFRALKQTLPGCELTLLTSSAGAQAAALVPEIDTLIRYDAPWMKSSASRDESVVDLKTVEEIRGRGFGGAVIFTVYSQSPLPAALLCYLSDIPLRLAHCRENPYRLLTHWVPEPEPDKKIRHETRRQLDLVATLGCRPTDEHLSLRVPAGSTEAVLGILRELRIDLRQPLVVVHPGASAPSRRYAPEGFSSVARRLALEEGCSVVFTGTASETDLVDEIRQAMRAPSWSLAGRLDFGQMVALVRLAHVVVSNNTAPVHIAAAVGTPVVDLYALTNPQHTPWMVPNRVLSYDVPCKFCYKSVCPEGHHNCLRLVAPETVFRAAVELLQAPRADQLASAGQV